MSIIVNHTHTPRVPGTVKDNEWRLTDSVSLDVYNQDNNHYRAVFVLQITSQENEFEEGCTKGSMAR